MSGRTQFELVVALIGTAVPLFIVSCSVARADSASAKMNQSINDFYNAVRKGRDQSPQAFSKLRKKIIEPAERDFVRRSHEKANRQYAKYLLAHDPRGPRAPSPGFSDEHPAANAQSDTPPVALDGSKVPKELDFPGKAKKPAGSR